MANLFFEMLNVFATEANAVAFASISLSLSLYPDALARKECVET